MSIDHDAAVDRPDDAPATLTADATYRGLCSAGLSAREAGLLTGWLVGLPVVPGGWSISEVERLLFVRALVRAGRMGS